MFSPESDYFGVIGMIGEDWHTSGPWLADRDGRLWFGAVGWFNDERRDGIIFIPTLKLMLTRLLENQVIGGQLLSQYCKVQTALFGSGWIEKLKAGLLGMILKHERVAGLQIPWVGFMKVQITTSGSVLTTNCIKSY